MSRCSTVIQLTVVMFVIMWHSTPVTPYKILMSPMPVRSHVFSMMAIAESLANRGHEVTMVVSRHAHFDVPENKAGQRQGVFVERFEDGIGDMEAMFDNMTMKVLTGQLSQRDNWMFLVDRIETFCRHLLFYNEPFIEHLKNMHFDLAVVDASALALCPYLLPHRLGIPFATYADWKHPLDHRLPWLPSFVPLMGLRFPDRMTFAERLGNTFIVALFKVRLLSVNSLSDVTDDYRRLYGHFDSLDELAARSLVWLYPRDHVLDYARPAMPHVISVGGLTVRRSSGQVPTDLEDFIKHAPNGVILVSFGSVASSFPVAIIEKMMNAFRQLDGDGFRFIFRLKDSRNVTVPDNVLIRKWIPQNDLLGHESTKLFITHCGNNGQYEAVYHGVPMIGFPLFADQPYNARRMEQKGLGIEMDILSFSSEELVDNVCRIVSDGSYKDRAAKLSAIFRADPQSPVERAAYWIEHVCRFGGDHLRSGGQDLAWYDDLIWVILLLVLTVIGIFVWCVWKVTAFVVRNCFARRGIDSAERKRQQKKKKK